jgi:hypothetical protein
MRFHFKWLKFGRKAKVEAVRCVTCVHLERTLESKHSEYLMASSEAFRHVSSDLAAFDFVEVERARNALKMHRSVCAFVIVAEAAPRSGTAAP